MTFLILRLCMVVSLQTTVPVLIVTTWPAVYGDKTEPKRTQFSGQTYDHKQLRLHPRYDHIYICTCRYLCNYNTGTKQLIVYEF